LLYCEFDRPVTEAVGKCKIIIDNNDETYSGKFSGGETIRIYIDMSNATTKQFEGTLEKPEMVFGEYGNTLEIAGSHVSAELVDKTVTKSYTNTAISTILTDLIDTYASGYTANNVSTCSTLATVSWFHKPFWSCVVDLCQLANYDCYVDNDKDFHFFERNSIDCELDAVVFEDNLIELTGLGKDTTDVKNRVIVYGEDDQGLPIIYTAEDAGSQSSYNVKEHIIKDTNIKTMAEAEDRAKAELALLKEPEIKGQVRSYGLVHINPGELIVISSPPHQIHARFRVTKITHIIDMANFFTDLEVEKIIKGIPYYFRKRKEKEIALQKILNPNELKYSYNFTFDDDSNIESHSGTETKNGKLILSSGQTSGTMITTTHTANDNISQVELKFVGSNLDNSTFEISVNDGMNYETITRDKLFTVSHTGNQLKLKITLRESGTTRPEIDSLALLYR